MKTNLFSLVGAALLLGLSFSGAALADVPAGYTGTPFKGTPKAIPGRVNLIDFDLGGPGVAFQVVHQGDVGCAGPDYRTDRPAPTLCKTSAGEGDKWIAPSPLAGTTYPSATTADYYVGAIRPGDWVNVTVDVKQAGSYKMITTWASDGPSIDIKLSFNNVQKIEIKVPSTGGGGTGYHAWRPDDNVGTIQLDAGVQVMKFQSVFEHVNMDYLEFQLVGADGGIIPNPDSGAAGAGGTTGAGGGVAAGGAAGAAQGGAAGAAQGGAPGAGGGVAAGGAPGAGGDTATAGGAAGATTGAGGAAGTLAAGGAAGTATAGTAGAPAPAETAADSGGCSCSLENRSASRNAIVAAGLLLAGIALRRNRRRS